MFTDREIAGTSERDQSDASIKEMARDIGAFYKGLIGEGVPKDLAKSLAGAFAALVVFPGCGCEGE